MARYEVNLSDGRQVTLEADQEPSEADVLKAIDSQGAQDGQQQETTLRNSLGMNGQPIPHDSMERAAQNFQEEQQAPMKIAIARWGDKVTNPEQLARFEKVLQRQNESPLPTPGIVGATGYAVASPFTYAGRVLKAIPSDLAEDVHGDTEGGLFKNITTAAMSPTDLEKPLPIDEKLRLAGEDEAQRGQFPWRTSMAGVSTGIAQVAPKIAALALAPESLPWQMGAAGGLFGLQEDGSFSPKDAAIGALMPGVGGAARKVAGEVIAKSLTSGSQVLSNPLAQKIVESLSEQAALNAYSIAVQAPELIELRKTNPDEFWKRISTTVGQNIAFGMLGSKNMVDEKVPSETQKWFEARADEEVAKLKQNPPSPQRRLGIRMPDFNNAINTPELEALADRALQEATNQKLLVPGEVPAMELLKRQGQQITLQPSGSRVADRPEGVEGGRISFSSPAEGYSIPSARQSAIEPMPGRVLKPSQEPPIEPAPKEEAAPMKDLAKEMGYNFDGVQDWGEGTGKLLAFTVRDVPENDPTYGATFYVPEGTPPEMIRAMGEKKLAAFREGAKPAEPVKTVRNSDLTPEQLAKSKAANDEMAANFAAQLGVKKTAEPAPQVTQSDAIPASPATQVPAGEATSLSKDKMREMTPDQLRSGYDEAGSLASQAIKDGKFDDASKLATQQQFYSEVLKEKTGSKVQEERGYSPDMDVQGVTPLSPESGSPLSATESLINRTEAKPLRKGLITGTAAEKWADEVLAGGATHAGPDVLAAYAVKGAALLEKGTMSVTEWGKKMVSEFGSTVEPHLQKIWDNIHATVSKPENEKSISTVDLWKGVGPKIAAESPAPGPAPVEVKPSVTQRIGNVARNVRDFVTTSPVPKLTRAGVQDAAVQHAYARVAAPRMVDDMLSRVFPESFQDPEAMSRVMDILNKDNILGGYDEFLARAQAAAKAGDTSGARKWTEMAKSVGDAQDIAKISKEVEAAKNDPVVSGAITRWNEHVSPELDTLYNEMKGVDPTTPREGRGRVFGARVNLLPKTEEANWQRIDDPNKPAPTPSASNFRNPNAKRDKFDRAAKFTGNYSTDPQAVLSNVLYPRWNEVTKLRFYDSLVKSGHAQWIEPGADMPTSLAGETPKRLQVKVPETGENGHTQQVEKTLAVPESMVGEIRRVLDTDYSMKQNPIAKGLTQVQLLQLADATAHLKNIHSVIASAQGTRGLFTDIAKKMPGLATGDAVVRIGKVASEIASDSPEIRSELAFMAKNGMLREHYPATGIQKITKMQDLIHHVDTASRVVMNRFFDNMVSRGLVEDNMQQRRAFVQQIGEYNKRLMGPSMQFLSRAGISPFIVAGRNFNKFAKRSLIGSPGVKGANTAASLKMRAVNLVGLATVVTIPAMINALTTGSIYGRRGTPIGAVDLGGQEDDKGNHKVLDLLQLMGIRRGLRATGIQSIAEGISTGRPVGQIVDNAISDIASTAAHPWMGPAAGAAYSILTGKRLDLRGGASPYVARKVAPGESQLAENARVTLENQNSLIYGALRPLFNDTEKSYGADLLAGMFKAPLSAVGIQNAKPPELAEAQKLAASGEQMTAEQADRSKVKRDLAADVRANGPTAIKKLEDMVAAGDLDKAAKTDIEKRAKLSQIQYTVEKYLSPQDAMRVYGMASPENKDSLRKIIALKIFNNQSTDAPEKTTMLSSLNATNDDAMQYPPIKFTIQSGGKPFSFLLSTKQKLDYETKRAENMDKVQKTLEAEPGWKNLDDKTKAKLQQSIKDRVDNVTKTQFFSGNYQNMKPLQ